MRIRAHTDQASGCEPERFVPLSTQPCPSLKNHANPTITVLGDYKGQFKLIFDTAQGTLLDTFGMELHELPLREKITIREKRAAATTTTTSSTSAAKSSNQWVLPNKRGYRPLASPNRLDRRNVHSAVHHDRIPNLAIWRYVERGETG